jgi:biotin transport system substrate-specific component
MADNTSHARAASTTGFGAQSVLATLGFAIAGSLLLWASAKIKVPFWPVPMTMQPFVVLALGLALGWKRAGLAVTLYLAEGAAGLPVFTDTPQRGIGIAYMVGPTGGYLAGFLAAAVAVGWMKDRGFTRSIGLAFVTCLAGIALIYLPGVAWLSSFVGFEKAITFGVTPFIFGDVLKALLAALAIPTLMRRFS